MKRRYNIVRMFRDDPEMDMTIYSGLTLKEAQAHCRNPETSSSTCTNAQKGLDILEHFGPWFDAYEEMR